jgi:hypothetical protein
MNYSKTSPEKAGSGTELTSTGFDNSGTVIIISIVYLFCRSSLIYLIAPVILRTVRRKEKKRREKHGMSRWAWQMQRH